MRVMSIFFAFLLVMGISLGGSALVGSIPATAQDDPQGEIPGGEMVDEATDAAGGAASDAVDSAADAVKGEIPGGEMTDEATDDAGAETDAPDESTEGEMPGGDMPDDAAK